MATAGLLCAAGSASAFDVLVVESVSGVTAGTQGDGQANCPDGMRVLGGGITSSGGYDSSQVNAAYPFDGSDDNEKVDDAWRGYIDASEAVTMTLRVACLGGAVADDLKYREDDVRVPAHSSKTLAVHCPDGYQVTGGGVSNSGVYDQVEVKASRPAKGGEAWEGTVRNFSDHLRKLYGVAVCATGRVANHVTYRHSDATAPAGEESSKKTNCPDGSAIAAGVEVKANNSNVNAFQLVGDATRSYVDAGGLADVKFTNYAVCLD